VELRIDLDAAAPGGNGKQCDAGDHRAAGCVVRDGTWRNRDEGATSGSRRWWAGHTQKLTTSSSEPVLTGPSHIAFLPGHGAQEAVLVTATDFNNCVTQFTLDGTLIGTFAGGTLIGTLEAAAQLS
jgi:hypothetical protein